MAEIRYGLEIFSITDSEFEEKLARQKELEESADEELKILMEKIKSGEETIDFNKLVRLTLRANATSL